VFGMRKSICPCHVGTSVITTVCLTAMTMLYGSAGLQEGCHAVLALCGRVGIVAWTHITILKYCAAASHVHGEQAMCLQMLLCAL
jgi:hypothetical protein